MKNHIKQLLLSCILLANAYQILAQTTSSDLLFRLDRSTQTVKVREVTGTDVFYTDLKSSTTIRKVAKAELWKVVFADGSTDVFNNPTLTSKQPATSASPASPVRQQASAPPSERPSVARTTSTVSQPAESADSPQSIIKYAPLSSFGYERVLANNRSIYAGLSLYSVNTFFTRVTAIGLKGEYRFYGLVKGSPKQAPEGLWVAPTILLWNVSVRDLDFADTESAFVAQLGGIVGYQWVFNRKISLEPALGLSLTAVGTGTESILGAGLVPLAALRVGYVLK